MKKKRKHNLVSKKGRQKINDQIKQLKDLLPECKDVECNKASILHCTVKNLKKYENLTKQLTHNNQALLEENSRLTLTIQRLIDQNNQLNTLYDEASSTPSPTPPYSPPQRRSNLMHGNQMEIQLNCPPQTSQGYTTGRETTQGYPNGGVRESNQGYSSGGRGTMTENHAISEMGSYDNRGMVTMSEYSIPPAGSFNPGMNQSFPGEVPIKHQEPSLPQFLWPPSETDYSNNVPMFDCIHM